MDAETSKKISELAANLKRLHLAATMEEAYQRAKEMILHHKVDRPIGELVTAEDKIQKTEKSIGELHADLQKEARKLEKESEKAENQGECLAKSFEQVKEQAELDKRSHELEKSDTKDLDEDIKEVKKRKEDAEDIVEEAEYVQSHTKE